MSPEKLSTGQPSLFNPGEGCQEVPNDERRQGSSSVGGVGAGGGLGKGTGLNREISRRGAATPQPTVQAGPTSKAGGARGEVGVARSSVDPEKNERSGERRGGTWTHATKSSAGPGDGWSEGEYLFDRIQTPLKVRKLQLALDRKAKADEPKSNR